MKLKIYFSRNRFRNLLQLLFLFVTICGLDAQFVHPGLSHKKSDLDRMRYMVQAKIDPWYTSYQNMCALSTAQYDYEVQGDVSITEYGLDRGWKDPWFDGDARAAYYGALRWYIEEDERYAEKAIEAIMAWTGLTNHAESGMSLKTAPIWLMIEAAEIIKHTYNGWSAADQKKFGDMLVYPGYSSTTVPSGNRTWYWNAYMFDEARAGNQELCGVRTVAAIGVFLDNEIIYDRAMRYVSNQSAREDDLAYAPGPRIQGTENEAGSTDYSISYDVPSPDNSELNADWGYCGVLPYNIYPNGQNVESSRDQGHTVFSLGLLSTIGEIAWNQGYDFFGLLDSRILKGLEYSMRYCVSASKSFADQPEPWEATTFIDLEGYEEPEEEHASYDFIQITNRTKRNKGQNINPDSRNAFITTYTWELPIAHYVGRGLKTEQDLTWTIRARDYAREVHGTYETASTGQDYTGYGALSYYRAEGCFGDPISGFDADGLPVYAMNVLPMTIEAENFDYFTNSGEGLTYSDASSGNSGNVYRTDENVDIEECDEGGYNIGWIEDGEYYTYTLYVPGDGKFNVSLRYAAKNAGGTVSVYFDGVDKTGAIALPATTGWQGWQDITLGTDISLSQGVQSMKILVGGSGFNINNITIDLAEKLEQTVTFDQLPIREIGDDNVELTASASSGLDISFSSSNTSVASIVNGSLQINGSGITTVTASQLGNDIFKSATATQIFQVNQAGSAIQIEAEDYISQSGLSTESTEDVGGGYNLGNTTVGDYAEYSVNITDAGTYLIEYRIASSTLGGTLSLTDNGTNVDNVTFGATGGWQLWNTVSSYTEVFLTEGTHTLIFTVESAGWNINWFKLIPKDVDEGTSVNLALYGIAEQSSSPYADGPASNANDGDTNGQWNNGSVTHTGSDANAWWEVVLDDTYNIGVINIYGRTDCCAERMANFTVSVLDASDNVTFTQSYTSYPDPLITLDANAASGNKVRVQLDGTERLSLAEVEVFESELTCATFSTIEAEDFESMSGVVDEGSNVGFIQNGDWAMYSNIDLTCATSFSVSASSQTSGGNIEVRLGSSTGTLLGTVAIAGTGNWNSWQTSSINFSGVSGLHDVYLVFTGGSGYLFNLDWIEFSSALKSASFSPDNLSSTNSDVRVYPNPVSDILYVESASEATVEVYSLSGRLLKQAIIVDKKQAIDLSDLTSGAYLLKVTSQGAVDTQKILKK